jgi:glycosyltransferase involved in cell wall biosynthesis
MNVLLYRRSLDVRSGAGQLILMQAAGLKRAGAGVRIACERGAARFFLRTGWVVRPMRAARAEALRHPRDCVVVDHGACLTQADVTFVHNLYTEAQQFSSRAEWVGEVAREHAFFASLADNTPIVANSKLVKAALIRRFALAPERVLVHYPGFSSAVFKKDATAVLRERARARLGQDSAAPVVGLVTSGDFAKRGLDIFLAAAQLIAARNADVRFLIVGSKRLPDWAAQHSIAMAGYAAYRPKDRHPELWLAALDLLLYPALFEEYGIVVAEAQALGVPVLTSRRVGAAECLPAEYAPWVIDEPSADAFADKAIALLGDPRERARLSAAGIRSVAAYDDHRYVGATVTTILGQKR